MYVKPLRDRFQLQVKNRLLSKPFYATFDTEVEARNYGAQMEAMLANGVVPEELRQDAVPRGDDPQLAAIIHNYRKLAPLTPSDDALLGVVVGEVGNVRLSGVTLRWAEGYVAGLKSRPKPPTPGTIRKRVGALARVVDWHVRRDLKDGQVAPVNILRMLPRGYSLYLEAGTGRIAEGAPRDQSRDRRLTVDEEDRIRRALAGEKAPDRERALVPCPEFTMLFSVIVDTGMRLREAYRLRRDQIDLSGRVISVEGTKGHRGRAKPRTVPLKRALLDRLTPYLEGREGRLFPSLWDGTADDLDKATHRLSVRFRTLFGYAGCGDVTEHDLRHEATCRWFTLRTPSGGWVFSDVEVCRIMGWSDTRMALRYASLRGSDLAARLLD